MEIWLCIGLFGLTNLVSLRWFPRQSLLETHEIARAWVLLGRIQQSATAQPACESVGGVRGLEAWLCLIRVDCQKILQLPCRLCCTDPSIWSGQEPGLTKLVSPNEPGQSYTVGQRWSRTSPVRHDVMSASPSRAFCSWICEFCKWQLQEGACAAGDAGLRVENEGHDLEGRGLGFVIAV